MCGKGGTGWISTILRWRAMSFQGHMRVKTIPFYAFQLDLYIRAIGVIYDCSWIIQGQGPF